MLTLEQILRIACIFNALLIIAIKWGITDYYQLYRPKILPSKCNFCLFFWCAMVCIIAMNLSQRWSFKLGLLTFFDALTIAIIALFIFSNIANAYNKNQ
jgi:hypothetical protein